MAKKGNEKRNRGGERENSRTKYLYREGMGKAFTWEAKHCVNAIGVFAVLNSKTIDAY